MRSIAVFQFEKLGYSHPLGPSVQTKNSVMTDPMRRARSLFKQARPQFESKPYIEREECK